MTGGKRATANPAGVFQPEPTAKGERFRSTSDDTEAISSFECMAPKNGPVSRVSWHAFCNGCLGNRQ